MQPLAPDACLHKQGGVGRLRHKVQHLTVQLDAVLQARKIQQLLHHGVQAVGFGADHRQAAAAILVVGVVDVADGFDPALNGGQRGAQLMADRGDKLVFQPLGFGKVARHLVDGLAQPPDLVIVAGVGQARAQIAVGNAVGGGFHLAQGAHDGAHKKQPAPHRNQQHQQPQPHRQRDGVPPLLVGKAQAGDQPHGGDVTRRVGHQHGFGHDTLALRGGVDVVASALQECQREVVAAGQVGAADTAAVCQNDARCVQQHKFKLVFFVELLHRAAQGAGAAFGGDSGIARRAGCLQASLDGGKPVFHRALHAAVQCAVAEIQKQPLRQNQCQHGHQQAAAHPSLHNTGGLHRTPPFL